MKTNILLLILFSTLLGASCKKEMLTKETQEGANTFSCKINGKVYRAKTELLSKGITGGLRGGTGNFSLLIESVMYNGDNSDYTIDIKLNTIMSEGEYNFSNYNNRAKVYDNRSNGTDYASTSGYVFTTKIDPINNIVSGRFEFEGLNSNNNEKIFISEGRFDIKN